MRKNVNRFFLFHTLPAIAILATGFWLFAGNAQATPPEDVHTVEHVWSIDSLTSAYYVDVMIARLTAYNPGIDSLLLLSLDSSLSQTALNSTIFSADLLPSPLVPLTVDGNDTAIGQEFFMNPGSHEYRALKRTLLIETIPFLIPVDGKFSSGFGMRNHPVLGGRRAHKGVDIAAPTGTPIHAAGGGTIVFSGRKSGYGNVVIVDHGFGYTTLYAHCSELLVEVGQQVDRGDRIALVGSTGRSTGPHLHYEVRVNDQHVDPVAFLVQNRTQIAASEVVADNASAL